MAPVTELARTSTMLIGNSGPIFVSVWAGESLDIDYDRLELAEASFAKRNPKFYSLTIITRVVATPKGAELAKRRGLAVLKRFAPNLLCSASVISSRGLGAAVARSFTTAFNMMSGLAIPMKVFDVIPAALVWAETVPTGVLQVELVTHAGDIAAFCAPFAESGSNERRA